MEIASYLIQWHKKILESGWLVSSTIKSQEKYIRIKSRFNEILSKGLNLRDLNYRNRFLDHLKKCSFNDEFENFRPDKDFENIKVFYVELSDNWEVPWELSLGNWHFDSLRKTIFLRVPKYNSLQSYITAFNDKLQILILEGSPGLGKTNLLKIGDETKAIKDAIENLPTETRNTIALPIVRPFIKGQLLSDLNSTMPHIIWFNGHGSTTNNSQLLDSNNQWVNATDFSSIIIQSKSRPNYIFFSACDTALAPLDNRTNYVSPQLFQLLENRMPITILAMQSPIQSKTGTYLAQEIILSLRNGYSLELSFSDIRARLKNICLSSTDTWRRSDWASPVLWTNKKFSTEIHWNVSLSTLERLQLLSINKILKSDESIIQAETFYEDIEAVYSETIIPIWITHNRLWLKAEQSKQLINLLYKIVNQLIHRFGFAPLVIDMFSHSQAEEIKAPTSLQLFENLKSWAHSIAKKINISSSEKKSILKLVGALNETSDIQTIWKELCSLEEAFLVIINPPLSDDPGTTWFWKAVESNKNKNFIWCVSNAPLTQQNTYWKVDNIIKHDFAVDINTALKEEPKLIKTLAFLDHEIRPDLIKQINLNNNHDFENKDYWGSLFITTPFGPLINVTAKQMIRAHVEEEEIIEIHNNCSQLLYRKILTETDRMNVVLWEKLLFHSVQAQLSFPTNTVGKDLINYYYSNNLPWKLIAASKQVAFGVLNDLSKLRIGWAYMQLFEIEKAAFFLDSIDKVNNDLEDFNKAERFALVAENIKSKGGENIKDEVYGNLDKAIAILNQMNPSDSAQQLKIKRYLLKLKHDKIRILQYLNYDLETAKKEYLDLLKEWRADQDEKELNRAVIKRNLAECIRKIAEHNLADKKIELNNIRQLISNAEKYIDDSLIECKEKYPDSIFHVEILYEKAKLAAFKAKVSAIENSNPASNQFTDEEKELLEEAIQIAKEKGYHMILTILKSRIFRRYQTFDITILESIIRDFDYYTHGWAIRSQLDLLEFGAQHCFKAFNEYKENTMLNKALNFTMRQTEIFKKYRYLSNGQSDKDRIITTFCRLVTIFGIKGDPAIYSKIEEIYSSYSFIIIMLDKPGYETCKSNFFKIKQ